MNNQTQVSIIINNYNYGRFLHDAIQSSIEQSYPNVEVIVVDDGSTDNSQEIICSYGSKIIPVFKNNGGQASCFNEGFEMAKGDLIIFLDADDYLAHDAVEKIACVYDADTISKIHWRIHKVDQDKKLKGTSLPDSALAHGNLKDQLIKYGPSQCGGPPNSPPTSGNAWSRKFLERIFPMPETEFRGGADKYLFVLAPLYGEIRKVDEALGYYRLHGKNNTVKSTYITSYFNRFEKCCESLSEHLAKAGIHIEPSSWPRDHWFHKVYSAMEIVKQHISANSTFMLLDDNHWVTERDFFGRTRIPFLEINGEYGGPPANNAKAIEEVERQRLQGATDLVIPWSCFWYLSTYPDFQKYLDDKYVCSVDDPLVRIYHLNNQKTD